MLKVEREIKQFKAVAVIEAGNTPFQIDTATHLNLKRFRFRLGPIG